MAYAPTGAGLRRGCTALLCAAWGCMASAQGIPGLQMQDAYFAVCGPRACPPPVDPLQRGGLALRLSTAMHMEYGSARAMPDLSALRLPSGALDGNRMLQQQEAQARASAETPLMLNAVGVNHAYEGRYAQALQQFEAAVRAASGGRDAQVAAAAEANLGVVAALQGRYDEARQRLEAALAGYQALQASPEPPASVQPQMQFPMALPGINAQMQQQIRQSAMQQLVGPQRAFESRAARAGIVRTLINLANLSAQLDRYAVAEEHLKKAQAAAVGTEVAPDEREVLAELFVMYTKAGSRQQADDARRRALATPRARVQQPASRRDELTTDEEDRAAGVQGADTDHLGGLTVALGAAPGAPGGTSGAVPGSSPVAATAAAPPVAAGTGLGAALAAALGAKTGAMPGAAPGAAAARVAPGASPGPAASPARPAAAVSGAADPNARAFERQHARLVAEATQRQAAGDTAGAREAWGRAALLAQSLDNPDREREALARLQQLEAAAGRPELAIFHGKRAVNLVQKLRRSLGDLDRAARQAYLADKKRSYVLLAQQLIDRQRLPEAEHVLRLLKEDEGQQFREQVGGAGARASQPPRGSVPYSEAEARELAVITRLAERARALETERATLRGTAGLLRAAAPESQDDIERVRLLELQVAEETLPLITAALGDGLPARIAEVRGPAAKPAAARTPAEARAVNELNQVTRFFERMLADSSASVRALERDAPGFATALSAAEAARLQSVKASLAAASTRLAPALALVAREPAADVPELPAPLQRLLGGGDPRLRRLWAIDREAEQLDADRRQWEAGLVRLGAAGSPPPSFAAADRTLLDTGRRLAESLPAGTALLYYLPGDDWLDILVVSRGGHRAARVAVARADLEKRVKAWRDQLENRRGDPVPPARALHDLVVAPVAGALQEAQATTLMLALDGTLRYLPFAALHDGQGWLAERYAIAMYTTAAPSALTTAPAPRWRVAAFGATAGGQGLSALPGVKTELEGVVRDPALRTAGVLPGTIRLDRAFTASALQQALRERQGVVHIASHFAFTGGEASSSFLLLGDGGKLTLAELNAPAYRFDGVDLVTLSACETALSGDDRFGQEVEGLGTLLQGQGAAAVLATLWPVADDSTGALMRELYAGREGRSLSRAQALREAQLALMRGGVAGSGGARGISRPAQAAPTAPAATPTMPASPYAHPFYWAPFVLMGNWL